MDKDTIEIKMRKWLHKSQAMARTIIRKFDADDIHAFRLDLKKKRAWLRLMASGKKKRKPALTKSLKQFYRNTGMTRDIELHRDLLIKRFEELPAMMPAEYIKLLNQKILLQQQWMSGFKWHKDFKREEEKLMEKLPQHLSKRSVQKFTRKKLKDLTTQLESIEHDETIHTIRKILKDILYTWNYTDHKTLPAMISSKKKLKTFASHLGDVVDHHFTIDFLSGNKLEELSNKQEKQLLEKMKTKLIKEKQELHTCLNLKFNQLRGQLLAMR